MREKFKTLKIDLRIKPAIYSISLIAFKKIITLKFFLRLAKMSLR
ncbi:hypothetical protein ID0561_14550 [Helicobacter pylori]